MTKIEFLKEQLGDINYKIIRVLEGEYAQHGLEESLREWTMTRLRGYFFMKSELDNKLQYEIEEGQYEIER